MDQAAQDRLRVLRQRLAELEPYPWEPIKVWIASAQPLVKAHYRDHFDGFVAATATPRWRHTSRVSSGGGRWGEPRRDNFSEATIEDAQINRKRATDAKNVIIAFLDGLLDLPELSAALPTKQSDVDQGLAHHHHSPVRTTTTFRPTLDESTGRSPYTSRGSNLEAQPLDAPIDFAILTAIAVERRAVCSAFGITDKDRVKRRGRVYWRGKCHTESGLTYEIVIAQPAEMGQVEATALATEVAHIWNPRAAILVGIAASTKPDEVKPGDVVVGRSIYYYEHGKVTEKGTAPQPEMIPADANFLKHYAGMADWDGVVPVPRPDGANAAPSVFQGVIASGDKVIAHEAARDAIASGQRKILALEMEGYGFSRAVWLNSGHISHLVIRGISDDGSKDKTDDWHKYAAASAACFTKHFLLDSTLR